MTDRDPAELSALLAAIDRGELPDAELAARLEAEPALREAMLSQLETDRLLRAAPMGEGALLATTMAETAAALVLRVAKK